ncbi:MAG: FMN-dependent oxidoreductase, nitrilotriacetate monooxygenase family [Halonotius sp. J07HN4]|nr:MAG: FMN-dependent oxidoreductase, nitrilotriacetate monooxygenase family [Halonotius sp. J07HN4]
MLDLFAYLNCSHSPTVEDAWQLSGHTQPDGYTDIEFWTELAELLENGGFRGMFFADAYNVANNYQEEIAPTVRHGEQLPENDPLPLLSALAAVTERIGLVATASTSLYPPYLLAKKLSTIDDLTDGRVGWNVVTSAGQLEFENIVGEYISHDERYEQADEFMKICYALWEESWEEGAVLQDAETGTFADPNAVSFIDHDGPTYSVPGPHMCAPTPQRTPVLFQAGQSDSGRAFATRHAEAIFSFHLSCGEFRSYASDVRKEMRSSNRDRNGYRLYPAVTPYVASTTAAAERFHKDVVETIAPETGLVRLSNHLNHDYSQYDTDAQLETIEADGIRGAIQAFMNDDQSWTVGEAAIRYARYPTAELVGTPTTVANELEQWKDAGADGFIFMGPAVPRTFRAVCRKLVPELRARGHIRSKNALENGQQQTLREQLFGTARLPDSHFERGDAE